MLCTSLPLQLTAAQQHPKRLNTAGPHSNSYLETCKRGLDESYIIKPLLKTVGQSFKVGHKLQLHSNLGLSGIGGVQHKRGSRCNLSHEESVHRHP